jgi:SPP1 gp7 family putative phage head morphogenesis protein
MAIPNIRDQRGRALASQLAQDAYERFLDNEAVKILRATFKEIAAKVADDDLSLRERARFYGQLQQIDGMIREGYGRVSLSTRSALDDYADVMASASRKELGAMAIDAGGSALVIETQVPVLPLSTVRAIATLPIDGLRLGDWWQGQANSMTIATRRAIQIGMTAGETPQQIAQRIMPPRKGLAPAVYRQARAQSRTIVRTALTAVHANAALETYASVGDGITSAYELLTARDSRVSKICAALDGMQFSYDDPNRKTPPFHLNCRTTILPVLNYAALGLKEPKGRGTPLTVQSFDSWLRSASTADQVAVLGTTRARWYGEGRLSLRQLIDEDDRVLTLPELADRLGVEWP